MDAMQRAEALTDRLSDGPPILLDGGTGTEIERMGAVMHPAVWSALASVHEADTVRSVHAAFLDAGAQLIIANTYSANYHVMNACGLDDQFEPANRRALELALEAREQKLLGVATDRPLWVAGSMSTTTFSAGIDQSVIESVSDPGAGYQLQADIIASAGVDLIVLEMMRDVTQTRLCQKAALETGLPVWLGLSVERTEEGSLVFHGSRIPFSRGLDEILTDHNNLQAVGVMHSEIAVTAQALELLRTYWDGPLFAYPHHGVFEMPHWRFDNTLSPNEFAQAALGWVKAGAVAVGGCCGVRPKHICELRRALENLKES